MAGALGFIGLLLLAAGPLVILFLAVIARKSFLVLLFLGSAFYWLVTLFLISAFFRGFEPLDTTIGPYAALVLVGVAVQEAARFGLWRFHRLTLRVLTRISRQQQHSGAKLSVADDFALSFTHGLAHASLHSTLFSVVWLPLCIGHGTVYVDTCPQMSYFFMSALSTLGFAALLTGAMVLCFDGLERRDLKQGLAPSFAHLAAGLITLINFIDGGCVISVPLLMVGGLSVAAWAGSVWWRRTGAALRMRPSSTTAAAAAGTAAETATAPQHHHAAQD